MILKILLKCSFVFSAAQTKISRIKPGKPGGMEEKNVARYIYIFTFPLFSLI